MLAVPSLPPTSPLATSIHGTLRKPPSPADLDSADPDHARTLIPLEPVREEIIGAARFIAQELSTRSQECLFGAEFERRAVEILPSATQEAAWQRVVALAGYFTVRASGESYSYARTLPRGLIDPTGEHHQERVETVIRYALVNRLGYDSARKIETLSNLHPTLGSVGLSSYLRYHCPGALRFFELGFPVETSGDDPAIRLWKLDIPGKWLGPEGAALSARATAWMLRFGERMVTRGSDGSFTFDLDRMRGVVWHEVFERHNLRSLIEHKRAPFRTFRDALTAGATLLGRPDLFGYAENQLLPGTVRPRSRWMGEAGQAERRELAQEVWRIVRSKYPLAFDTQGDPIPARLKEIPEWRALLSTPKRSCLARSFGTARRFLEQSSPEIFGWEAWQIKPWEMDNREGKWEGPEGQALFSSVFSYLLGRHGLGKLTLRHTRLDYDLSLQDFLLWKEQHKSAGISATLKNHLSMNGFAGGLAYGANDSLIHAFAKLFGESPEPLRVKLQTKDLSKVIAALLAPRGGALRIAVTNLSQEAAAFMREEDAAVRPAPSDPDTLLMSTHRHPLLHQKFAILTENDIKMWRELRIDPARDRRFQDAFFSNRSWKGTPMEAVQNHSPEQVLLGKLLKPLQERGWTIKTMQVATEIFPESHDLRALLDLVRLKIIDSVNIQRDAGDQLKEALLRVTQSSLPPARILQDCAALRAPSPQEPSMLDLLEATVLFAVKVEAARGA